MIKIKQASISRSKKKVDFKIWNQKYPHFYFF